MRHSSKVNSVIVSGLTLTKAIEDQQ